MEDGNVNAITILQDHYRRVRAGTSADDRVVEFLSGEYGGPADTCETCTWNVKGAQFQPLHELFGEIASHLEQQADDVAERITALGGVAQGTARQVAAASNLPQYDLDAVSGEEHLGALAKRLALVGGRIRTRVAVAHQLGDDATGDLLTEIVRQADKDLWFLEAHVQAGVNG